MGLDMYLEKRIYVGANYKHNNVTGRISLKRGDKKIKVKLNKVSTIIEEVGYWRKCNAVHKWFVDNVQNGIDDCRDYYVSYDNLETLGNLCKRVVKEKNPELLPSSSGWLFGSTEYDEWYYKDLKYTSNLIDKLNKESDYSYNSSW